MKYWILTLFFCFSFLGIPMTSFAQEAEHTEVIKKLEGNPSLAIVNFQGTEEERGALERALISCDWFQLVKGQGAEQGAQILLQAKISPNKGGFLVQTMAQKAEPQGKETIVTTSQWGLTLRSAIWQTVDSLLNQLYQVPAFCTRKIVFSLADVQGMKELFECSLDGRDQRRLTFQNGIATEPDASGDLLVYTLLKDNQQAIVMMNRRQGGQKIISRTPGLNSAASLSPDGTKIVLPLSLGGQVDLYLLDLQQNRRKRLTKDKYVESSPTWSPDGKNIAFVSNKMGNPQLFLISLENYKVTNLTSGLGLRESLSPNWSTVNGNICFTTKRDGRYAIAVLNLKTQSVYFVSPEGGFWEAPVWAPDGRHIVCTRSRTNGSQRDLYIIDSWMKTARQLSQKAQISLPTW